jgi:hypothetical protein
MLLPYAGVSFLSTQEKGPDKVRFWVAILMVAYILASAALYQFEPKMIGPKQFSTIREQGQQMDVKVLDFSQSMVRKYDRLIHLKIEFPDPEKDEKITPIQLVEKWSIPAPVYKKDDVISIYFLKNPNKTSFQRYLVISEHKISVDF